MHTLKGSPGKRKRGGGGGTREDLQLLRLLQARRYRLEGEMGRGWDHTHSLEIDLVLSLEECVLTGWGKRLGMR
jgi:hypothetical protein